MLLATILACHKPEQIAGDSKKTDCVEKTNPDRVCTEQYDPVCGCNLKTYGNACIATIYGIEVLYNGECKKN